MEPKVSICIPTYNGAQYLAPCLDSVLSQTFPHFEVLLVDDRSSDQTLAIANAYASRDSRVRIVSNEKNLGLVGNWNRCAERATGEWIKFVFQDDLIEPACLEMMLAAAKKNTSIVCCRRSFIFDKGTDEQTRHYYETLPSLDSIFPGAHEVSASAYCAATLGHVGVNFVGEPIAVMLHRRAFEKFGVFNPNLIMMCDFEFWTRIAVHTGIAYIPRSLAVFRVHQGSTSAFNFSARKFRTMLDAIVLLHDFVFLQTYEPLRFAASHQDNRINLRQRLVEETRGAQWMANDAAKRERNPDPSIMSEWMQFLQQYPRLVPLAEDFVPPLRRLWNAIHKTGETKPIKVSK